MLLVTRHWLDVTGWTSTVSRSLRTNLINGAAADAFPRHAALNANIFCELVSWDERVGPHARIHDVPCCRRHAVGAASRLEHRTQHRADSETE